MQTAILDIPKGVRLRTLRRAAERDGCEVVEVKQRDLRRTQEREQITTSLERFVDGVLAPIMKLRTVTLTKAGNFTKARYEGRSSFVFGFDERDARSRLKAWDNKGS
jgi:hypothetical protein